MTDFYFAASWPTRPVMREHREDLRKRGHAVTSAWIDSEDPEGMGDKEIKENPDKALAGGYRELSDIDDADAVIVFTGIPSSTGGYHVEFGYSLGKKVIYVVGPRVNVFYSLPILKWFPDWEAFLTALDVKEKRSAG